MQRLVLVLIGFVVLSLFSTEGWGPSPEKAPPKVAAQGTPDDALRSAAKADLGTLKDFIAANPKTPRLLDIITNVAALKAALSEGKISTIKSARASLQATLSKEKGFSAFMASSYRNSSRSKITGVF